jgi:hypothetical protein
MSKPVLIAPVLLFYACATLQQPDNGQDLVQFSRYQTFMISGAIRTGTADPLFTIPDLDVRIRREIEDRLMQRGMRSVTSNPEISVYYYFGVSSPEALFPLPYRISPRSTFYLTGGHAAHRVGERFTIDLVEFRSNELLWSGTDSTFSGRQASRFQLVSGAVQKIIQQLPP